MILYENEPFELCMLKKQLANLSCKCSVCGKLPISESFREIPKGIDKEIQSGPMLNSLEQTCKHVNTFDPNFDLLCNSVSCAGCYIALNLLKARETKVCKDEEVETMLGISCCDKSTGQSVKFVDTTTSTTSIKASKHSIASFCEKVTTLATLNGIMKKRSNDHVTFSEYFDEPVQNVQTFYDECFCLQNFIDSIRPPLTNI